MDFNELCPGTTYVVEDGGNTTFQIGAHVQLSDDGKLLFIDCAGKIGSYRQPAWIEVNELSENQYNGVLFSQV